MAFISDESIKENVIIPAFNYISENITEFSQEEINEIISRSKIYLQKIESYKNKIDFFIKLLENYEVKNKYIKSLKGKKDLSIDKAAEELVNIKDQI